MALDRAVSIAALRELARRRLPRPIFEFVDGGAQDEVTLRANRDALAAVRLLPRALVDVSAPDTRVQLLGEEHAWPLVLAPTGLAGLLWPRGEAVTARAAAAHQLAYCLSMMSACSMEEVHAAAPAPFWFQLYLLRDRAINAALMDRARACGSRVLVFTVDTKIQGPRERDLRNGFTVPPRVTAANLLDLLRHPGWLARVGLGPRVTFGNLAGTASAARDIMSIARFAAEQYDLSPDWSALEWVKSHWGGPVAVKGILGAEDARRALDHGADAIIVSNHGGRQLDHAPAAFSVLPAVAQAVGGRAAVLLDGGVRRGADVVKALARGADACMVGRAVLYGLGAGGAAGVGRALDILQAEIINTLSLLGVPRASELEPDSLCPPWLP